MHEKNNKYIIRFYKELLVKENKRTIAYLIILSLSQIIVSLIPPILMMEVLDNAIPNHKIYMVLALGLGILIITVLEAVINYCLNKIYTKFSNKVYMNFQQRCISHLLEMSGEYYSNISSGEIFTTIFQDIDKIKGFVSATIFNFISDIIIAVCMFCFLLYLQWDLLLTIIIILPVVFFSQKYFQKLGAKKAFAIRESYGKVTGLLESMISEIMSLLFSKGEKILHRKYRTCVEELTQCGLDIDLVYAKNDGVLKFLSALINIDILTFGGIKVISSKLTIGGFMAFNMYVSKLIMPILEVSSVLMDIQSKKVSLGKVYQFLDKPSIIAHNGMQSGINEKKNNIVFKNVVFKYKDELVLDKLDIELKSNALNVIIGESGEGKSSIISLLYRLWDIQSGRIEINKTDLRNYDVKYIRSKLSILSQDLYLFNDTIYNNIILELDCSRDEVEKVAKIACIHDFVMSLPKGYDTIIGDRGIKLSGGEKQRICLARTIIRNAPILILDEPTTALDQLTEKKIFDNIRENLADKTIIIITHRLQSIIDADCIYILKDGRILSQGRHEELMKSNVYYKKMCMVDDSKNIR